MLTCLSDVITVGKQPAQKQVLLKQSTVLLRYSPHQLYNIRIASDSCREPLDTI